MPTVLHSIYQLRVSLKGVRPPIWRRLLVPSSIKLPKLHLVLQIAMGWSDAHLHQFLRGAERYGAPDPYNANVRREDEVRLNALLREEGDKIDYEYDFGDGWRHEIKLEEILPFDTGQRLPVCLKGSRACPPEDCGGPHAYRQLLDLIADELDDEYPELRDWLPGGFDPELFDLKTINAALRRL
ncbi:MAG: plasmid pRiA4b ORF-3 family protein [Thiohalobacteraceae bacterium]